MTGKLVATFAVFASFGVASVSFGQEAEAPPAQPVAAEDVSASNARVESAMTALGSMASAATQGEDMVLAACVEDKRDRAADVMELATSEMLVIRDPQASAQAKSFAGEKLTAAADRMEALVESARSCAGDQAPESEVDATQREAEQPKTVPMANPTAAATSNSVPPPVSGDWPAAASPSF